DKVAQIITFGTMGARAAIRDVGRALDVPLPEVDEIAKLIPAIPGKPVTIKNVLSEGDEFFRADLVKRYQEDDQVHTLVDTAQSLEGVARHASTHAAGVIISDKPLVEYTPLHRPTSGSEDNEGIGVVTQWPMEILDSIGLLKVDFLGLSTLTVLRRAAELIEQQRGVRYTMENIPYDVGHEGPDPSKKPEKLFEMLGRGEVAGVFQVEGAGMRRLMMQMKPHRFDNIIAAISLYRPGPMENIPEYIARMHGQKEVVYHHPDLEPILKDTYGILVYQEQIIRIVSDLAGYAPGEADMIRKAVGKKIRSLINKHRSQFIEGAMARDYSRDVCEAIWGDIEFFARYGFNKAHAADYAVITCQTAFLKAHYPVEYMTALLSVERNNTDKVATYLAETRRMGITVAPPNINQSDLDFTIEGNDQQPIIRYGLGAIKNAGTAAIELILEERAKNGLFKDLSDLCDRVDLRRVGKRAMESMVKVGVFDAWGTRPQLLESIDRIISHSGNTHQAAAAGQMSLFGGLIGAENVGVELLKPDVTLSDVDQREILDWEKELVGVYISEHPLSRHLDLLQDIVTATTADLDEAANGKPVTMLGLLTYLRKHVTKKGALMAFGELEDLQGTAELLFFPSTWKECQSIVAQDKVYIVKGKVRVDGGDRAKVIVDDITDNLTLAKPMASANTLPKPLATLDPDSDFEPQFDELMDISPESSDEENGAESENIVPPPPPNFEPDEGDWLTDPEPLIDKQGQGTLGRIIVVDVQPTGDWKKTCRKLVKLSEEYTGQDSLRIRIADRALVMDFPNQNTHLCLALMNAIEKVPAVCGVEVA
ncbi:MAG: DNA polymerase III subunit alpha, partial [Chloroflexota bacterium]